MLCKLIHFSDTHEIATLEHWHACFDKRLIGFFNSNVIARSRNDAGGKAGCNPFYR